MKYFDWDEAKNAKLKTERDICFEDVQTALEENRLLGSVNHPNQNRYPNQRIFIIEVDNYVFLVPYIEDKEKIFLKTIYPSRKFTSKYLQERSEK